MSNKLSASEAVYGFCGWLTGRKEITVISSHHDAAIVVGLVNQFCKANNLSSPRDGWTAENLSYPEEEEEEEGIAVIPEDVNKKEAVSAASLPGDEEALDYAGDV